MLSIFLYNVLQWLNYVFLGNTSDQFKVHDLNVEAEAPQEDEDEDEDENDWEDG